MHIVTRGIRFSVAVGLLFAVGPAGTGKSAAIEQKRIEPFPIRGYHQHIFPDALPMEVFHRRLEELKRFGYNLVVFGTGSTGKASIVMHADGRIEPVGCSAADLRNLVAHALKLGIEPVFEMKFIGKQLPILREVVEKYPDLVIDRKNRSTILNAAFRFPDGRDAYTATSLAVIDFLLGLYPPEHPPRYFLLGIDEFDADDMAELGRRMKTTPARAFADCLNRGTDHLLRRNVTPLIWGDMLLSPALGTDKHGVTVVPYHPDPRLVDMPGGAYHGAFQTKNDHALHTAVNFIRNRDRIIVVDWHYSPSATGEFPSVDYFQKVGFKDVWGAPWHDPENIRQFTRYAASRRCGGMLATAWSDAYQPEARLVLHFIIGTSAAFFRDPSIDPPPDGPPHFELRSSNGVVVDDEKHAGCLPAEKQHLRFRGYTAEPVVPRDGMLLIAAFPRRKGENALFMTLTTARGSDGRPLVAGEFDFRPTRAGTQYRVDYCYTDSATGYVYLKRDSQGFYVGKRRNPPPARPLDKRILLTGDFSEVTRPEDLSGFWLDGVCGGPLGWVRARNERRATNAARAERGLDMRSLDRVWFLPSDYLSRLLCKGFDLEIEARMLDKFQGNAYCALFTKGSFHTGFRLLVGQDRHVLFQLANLDPEGKGPLWVRSPPGVIPLNRWCTVTVLYRPPDPKHGASGFAEVRVNDRRAAIQSLPAPMPPSRAVVGIGSEFRRPTSGPVGKLRPNFPGVIRRFTLRSPQPIE